MICQQTLLLNIGLIKDLLFIRLLGGMGEDILWVRLYISS